MLGEKSGDGMEAGGWEKRVWKERGAKGQLLALGQFSAAPL